jgi:hypothetical protein
VGLLTDIWLLRKPEAGRDISLNKTKDSMQPAQRILPPVKTDTFIANGHGTNAGEATALAEPEGAETAHQPVSGKVSKPDKVTPAEAVVASARAETGKMPDTLSAPGKPDAAAAPVTALQGKASGVVIRGAASNAGDEKKNEDTVHYLQGTVTDNNGQPVPDATVMLKGRRQATRTDINGAFRLKTDSPDSGRDVVANAIGFQPASGFIRPSAHYNQLIALNPAANALDEVVVSGYSARKKEVADEVEAERKEKPVSRARTAKAEPAPGWPAYLEYINKHKQIPGADSLLKGIEIVSFTVDKNGERRDFRVERSLSPAHDAEVIRLIREGPPWKLLKGNRQRCRLSVIF